ncbi:hypothetical protein Golomagni_05782, partial [Golovinomyces magnicellulatus]
MDSEKINRSEPEVETAEHAPLKTDLAAAGFEQTEQDGHMQRGLKSRHIQLIALGGTIGTGLFIGSGSVLAETGPAPLFMSYIIMSALIWILTMDLAEMASYMPI